MTTTMTKTTRMGNLQAKVLAQLGQTAPKVHIHHKARSRIQVVLDRELVV